MRETQADPIVKERNKKVFGSILQHLGQAKKKLDCDDKVSTNLTSLDKTTREY
jgi:hypothetical protein